MTIVSISRGANSRGQEVAQKVATMLNCRCLAREDVIRGSGLTDVPVREIIQALDEPPSFIDRLLGGKAQYITTARAALLGQLNVDNVVYHGFEGHYFLKDISHAVKVRILAEMSERVDTVVARDGVSRKEAQERLETQDEARRQWGIRVIGVDPEDPSIYDIVLHVGKMGPDDVAEIICDLARSDAFAPTPASQSQLNDQALLASVEAVLLDMEIDLDSLDMNVHDGNVTVRLYEPRRTKAGSSSEFSARYLESLRQRLHKRTRIIPGLKAVHLENAGD